LEPLRFEAGPEIVCSTLAEGPFGVETQQHVESVTLPLRRLVEADNASDAFVIACYSDPGLHVCREGTERPVFGIAECGVLTALARAERFGVIAILQRSIARHMRYLRQMGLTDRLAGERPLELSVAERHARPCAGHPRLSFHCAKQRRGWPGQARPWEGLPMVRHTGKPRSPGSK
jgi:allantoin racemase